MEAPGDKETPNREFERQMRRYRRAFQVNASSAPAEAGSPARRLARRTVFRALCFAHFSG